MTPVLLKWGLSGHTEERLKTFKISRMVSLRYSGMCDKYARHIILSDIT